MESISISVIDAIIIVVYLVFIIWWGLRHGKSSDAGSYFLAGRTMPWWVVGLSLFAASISSTTLIGQSGDSYSTGIAVFNYNLTGVVVMVFFATFLLPLYIKSKIFTIPEFLEKRFDKRSRYYFSAICIIGNIFLDAAGALYAAALIIKLMFPSASLGLIIVIFAILAASYTIPGGLSSAINAELIQAVILIAGSVILTCACFANGGGEYLAGLLAADDTSVKLIRPLNDPSTPWLGLIIGMPVSGIYFWANNQTLVQRVLSAKSVDEGRKGVMFNGFLTLVTLFIIIIPGLVARHHFPVSEYPAMSTPDSTLFTMDFYAKAHPEADSKHLVKVGKIAALAIIVIAAVWAPNIGRFGSLLKYYQEMLSYIAPPIVAAFLLGMFSKRVNADGAFTGLLTGLAMAVVMLFFRHRIFGDLHFLLIIPILLAFSMMAIYIASLFKPAPSAEKLADTTFRRADFRAETLALKSVPFYKNYRVWGAALLAACALILILFA